MPALITYAPRAPQNQFNPGGTGRTQSMRLPTPVQDTVTPQIIARAGGQLGHALMQYGKEQARERSVALALETMQEAEKEYAAFENDYMSQKRRKDAATAPQDFEQWMKDAGARYTEKLKDDGLALSLFSQQWGRRSIDALRGAGHYARREDEAWRGEVAEGEAATLMQRATALDDPAQIAGLRAEYKTKLSELLPGRDHTAHLAKVDQDLASNLIGRRMAQDDFAGASALAQQFKGELGSRYDETVTTIRSSQRSSAAYYQHQAEQAKAKKAEATAYTLMQDFGGDSAKAFAWIDQNAQSPEERTLLTRSYTFVRNTEDAKQQQVQQESLVKEKTRIDQALEAAKGDVRKINDTILSAGTEELQRYAQSKSERLLGVNKHSVSDPVAWSAAHDSIINSSMPFDAVVVKFGERLSDADVNKLKELSENEEAKENAKEEKTYFDMVLSNSSYAKTSDNIQKEAITTRLEYEIARRTRSVKDPEKRKDIILSVVHDRTVINNVYNSSIQSVDVYKHARDGKEILLTPPRHIADIIKEQAKSKGYTLSNDDIIRVFNKPENRRKLGY